MPLHWLEASERGLDVLVSTPSREQLDTLREHGCTESRLTVPCQKCAAGDATTFIRSPDQDATISMCGTCHDAMMAEARRDVIDRLKRQGPYPGEEAIYQPVELEECSGWKVLRPDSADSPAPVRITMLL